MGNGFTYMYHVGIYAESAAAVGVLRGCTSKRRRMSLTEMSLTVELVVSRRVICKSVSARDNSVLCIAYVCRAI